LLLKPAASETIASVTPAVIQRRAGGDRFIIYGAKTAIVLSSDEAERLASFITGKPHIQRHPGGWLAGLLESGA
jgi:hypothetical protein